VVLALLAVAAIGGYLERGPLIVLMHRVLPSTNTAAAVLPTFTDWRVSYAGSDGRLHAVSLDGATDVTGITLPGLAAGTSSTATPGSSPAVGSASPDGRYLAYLGSGGPVLVHLTAHAADQDALRSGNTIPGSAQWSPDSTRLAWVGAQGEIHLTSPGTLEDAAVPATGGQGIQDVLGWIDATHVVVRIGNPTDANDQIAAVDAATGQQRGIVSFVRAGYGSLHYRLSPDGARLFAWNTPLAGQPFTPILRNYDTASGQVRRLPNTVKVVGTNVSAAAWEPGAQTLAVASGSAATHDLKLWLIDAAGDSATSIGADGYPLGWTSDGNTLICGSAIAAKLGDSYTISAYTLAAGAPVPPPHVTLTDHALSLPWLGLVHTA
jgi:hypothetical protein